MIKSRCICSGILFADVACWPIDHTPVPGELVSTEKIELNLGGCASNVALDLSKLEMNVTLAGCVGDDALSDFILRAVSVPGVESSMVTRKANSCPGTAMHINVQGEDRRFICTTGANDLFEIDTKLEKLIEETAAATKEPKVFYLGGFLMLKALESEKTVQFLKKTQQLGWITLLDVVLSGDRSYWDAVKPLLPYTDLFLPNNHEGEAISGLHNTADQAKFFRDHGAKAVVITQGEFGTLYYGPDLKFHSDIFPMEFVSGSGAGDAFDAGYIAALLESRTPEECVHWGSALGASCVRGVSTTGAVFSRTELMEFLEHNPLQMREEGFRL